MQPAPSYLLLNGFGIYHLRLSVPRHLRSAVGKREIKKTLRTGNHREALRKARRLATMYQDQFDELTDQNDILNIPLNLKSEPVAITKKTDGIHEVEDVKITSETKQRQLVDPHTISLKDLISEYLAAMKEHCNSRTLYGYKAQLSTFLEILGNCPISDITRKDARESITIIKQLPPNRHRSKEFSNISIGMIIQMQPDKVISPTTVKLHIERISAMFKFAMAEQHTDYNPFTKLTPKRTIRPDQERKQFTDDNIAALFSPDNMKPDTRYQFRQIISKIAAYSGMRLEECAQMHISDIKQIDGIYCFDINDNDNKKLKNLAASRIVPIHSKLLPDLLAYLDGQKGSRLFPDLKKSNGKYGHNFSKWFTRHRRKCGINDSTKTFHSFRHNLATQLKHAGIEVTKAAAVLGHTVNGETYSRYGKQYPVKQLQEVIETINYGDLIP